MFLARYEPHVMAHSLVNSHKLRGWSTPTAIKKGDSFLPYLQKASDNFNALGFSNGPAVEIAKVLGSIKSQDSLDILKE
jgi:hypothetical protein